MLGAPPFPDVDAILEARPRSKLISFLRNPVDRVISDFRYARTPAHPPYRDFIERYPTLEAYVDSRESQNKMFRILSGNGQMPVSEAVQLLDERISFIGVVDMYPMSFNIIFRLFGHDRMPSVHKLPTEETDHNTVEASEELKHKIAALNAKDVAIYQHVRERLAGKREEWASLRRERVAG